MRAPEMRSHQRGERQRQCEAADEPAFADYRQRGKHDADKSQDSESSHSRAPDEANEHGLDCCRGRDTVIFPWP